MRKNVQRWALAAGAALVVLMGSMSVGCAGGDAPDSRGDASQGQEVPAAQEGPKTLKAGSTTYFYAESMDPASDWDSWYLSYYGIVENLCRVSDDLSPEPWLAKSVEQVDDVTWEIELNEGITFSNGAPLDAAAVKACWERTYAENSRAAETLAYDELIAEGNVLTIKTTEKLPSLPSTLCDPLLCVYYVGDDVADYADATPATGPYVKKEFVAEDHIVMVPNESYWGGKPKLDEVELICFADDNAITMAMQNGEIQAVAMPSASTAAVLAGEDRFTIERRTSSRADFIRMNMEHPLIQEAAVREAVAYCIDRDGYASVICQGSADPSWGVYSPTLPFGGTQGLDVTVTSCDPSAAARVLEEAGIVDSDGDGVRELNGTPVELDLYTCTNYERFTMIADDLQSKLADAGIKLNIVPTDYFLEDAETFASDDPDMTLDSYAMAPTGNQAYFANISFATDGSNNFGKYSNAEVDSLIRELDGTFDEAQRNELARQIAQQVLTDLPYVFFANSEAVVVAGPGVTGLAAAPSEYYFVTAETDVA